jgi:peptidyl-prolyl cis-trans isomerase C
MTDRRTGGRRFGLIPLIAVLAMSLAVAACGQHKGSEKPPEAGDTAVARVDGHTVWVSDVKREAVAQGLIGEGEPLDLQSDLFRQVLQEVIDQKLLASEAIKRKLDKDPLAQQRLAAARERILSDMLVEGVVEKAVTQSAINDLYQEQLRLARNSDELKARQIVVATQPQGEEIKKLLTAGASFDALAMQRSSDSATRFNGGDFGGYFTLDVMPEPYQVALKDAKVGDLIGPFAVDGGFAVVRVDEKRQEDPITLDAARPQIVRFLTYDKVRDLLERLRAGAKIETFLPKSPELPGAPQEPASAPPKDVQDKVNAPPATQPPATPPSVPPPAAKPTLLPAKPAAAAPPKKK